MPSDDDRGDGPIPAADELLAGVTDIKPIDGDEYRASYGEALVDTLNLDTWHAGEDLSALYTRLEMEIAEAVKQESRIRERIREEIFPRLSARAGAPPGAGVYQATPADVELVHRSQLFTGEVEACDGTSVVHDTLPITITQIGVCLVSYEGDQGTWGHRLYRRDLRTGGHDAVDETLELLERRRQRTGYGADSRRDQLSELGRRGIMTYAERAVLLRKSDARWRMGHGNPVPYELLTGSGMPGLLDASLGLLYQLICEHRRFVFVPSSPAKRFLLTIGEALRPLEFAVIDTLSDDLERVVERGHYRGREWSGLGERVRDFVGEVGQQIVVGAYRASALAPPHLFYAHADLAVEAALIAIADGALLGHRGFPMLIDLADTICRTTFDAQSFIASSQAAYVEAGAPHQYLNERQTRS